MPFELSTLPYELDALAPILSKETLEYHYGKHHKAYVTKLNELTDGTALAKHNLQYVVLNSRGDVFNNAAQVWNHSFYWNCLSPKRGGSPNGDIHKLLTKHFGTFDKFKETFTTTAAKHFGSGWAWLVQDKQGGLAVEHTSDAGNPMTDGKRPLLTVDVWEHAYYIDYRNERAKYLERIWEVVNWDFVTEQLK